MRYCPHCKMPLPNLYRGKFCKRCKGLLSEALCTECRQVKPIEMFYNDKRSICKRCSAIVNFEANHRWYIKNRVEVRERYRQDTDKALVDWLSRIKRPTKPLTEEQWLFACSYFNKCAVCGKDEITTRWIFVPPQLFGQGSYTKCNVIPVCDDCGATLIKDNFNPFYYMGNMPKGKTRFAGSIDNIVDYLQKVLEDDK